MVSKMWTTEAFGIELKETAEKLNSLIQQLPLDKNMQATAELIDARTYLRYCLRSLTRGYQMLLNTQLQIGENDD